MLKQLERRYKTLAIIVYILQIAAIFNGITAIIGVIINYLKLKEVKGTWLESHFHWQIRTFWYSLVWSVIGMLTYIFIIGIFILLFTAIWLIYRVVKGFIRLQEHKPI